MQISVIKEILDTVRETVKQSKEEKENLNIVCKNHDILTEKLSPELLQIHEEFVDALENNWSNDIESYFERGFKLGLLLAIECLQE